MTSLLAANQLQDDLFLFEINSKDIGISKLFKLLLSLFELAMAMAQLLWAPLLHKLQDMSRNRALFISEVRIIVRLLLF